MVRMGHSFGESVWLWPVLEVRTDCSIAAPADIPDITYSLMSERAPHRYEAEWLRR
jgi:hypothetical protein